MLAAVLVLALLRWWYYDERQDEKRENEANGKMKTRNLPTIINKQFIKKNPEYVYKCSGAMQYQGRHIW